MTRWQYGYVVWGLWFVAFLVIELLGAFKAVPWPTLSSTSWHAETTYVWLKLALFGFLLGLLLHIVFHVEFWAAMAFGIGVSLLAHIAHLWRGGWPK